ncbi:MAG: PH domain-containing protein [Micropruina sp.]
MEPVTFRPYASLRMASSLSVSLVAASALGWVMTPPSVQVLFSPIQLATLLLIIAIMVTFMMSVGLSYTRADSTGLTFRNGLRTHTLTWGEITAIRYREGDPWAYALLRAGDADRLPLMGIQRTDRIAADEHVAELRRRLSVAYDVEQP